MCAGWSDCWRRCLSGWCTRRRVGKRIGTTVVIESMIASDRQRKKPNGREAEVVIGSETGREMMTVRGTVTENEIEIEKP